MGKKGYDLVNEVEKYLWDISIEQEYGWVSKSSLKPDLLDERERFINNIEIKEEQLTIRLKLMKPVLDLRARVPIHILYKNNKFRI